MYIHIHIIYKPSNDREHGRVQIDTTFLSLKTDGESKSCGSTRLTCMYIHTYTHRDIICTYMYVRKNAKSKYGKRHPNTSKFFL